MHRSILHAAALGLLLAALAAPAGAVDKLKVGKAVPEAFSFVPLDIGMKKGFFQKYGVEAESIAFAGDAKMQQAMASDSIDLALGSGPAMAFIVKGSPIKGVAAMAGPPLLLAIVVRPDGPKTAADLKGKAIAAPTLGAVIHVATLYWLKKNGVDPASIRGVEVPFPNMGDQLKAVLDRGRRSRARLRATSSRTPNGLVR